MTIRGKNQYGNEVDWVLCYQHGYQQIVAMGPDTVTLECGATGNTEDGFTHYPTPGEKQ